MRNKKVGQTRMGRNGCKRYKSTLWPYSQRERQLGSSELEHGTWVYICICLEAVVCIYLGVKWTGAERIRGWQIYPMVLSLKLQDGFNLLSNLITKWLLVIPSFLYPIYTICIFISSTLFTSAFIFIIKIRKINIITL